MGILNITPDSFYDGGKHSALKSAIETAGKMISEGASMLDIGAFSSRPGAEMITEVTEWARIKPVLKEIRSCYGTIPISIDTFRSGIVRRAYDEAGIDIVNDISGGDFDNQMFDTVANLGVAYVCMHMRGNPQTMQTCTEYENLVQDIIKNLAVKLAKLRAVGVCSILVDPGFGFAKTIDQNYELLQRLNAFEILDSPVLVGVSRKSMITKVLDCLPSEALNGSSVLNTMALMKGAAVLRVHDVKEAVECVKLYTKLITA